MSLSEDAGQATRRWNQPRTDWNRGRSGRSPQSAPASRSPTPLTAKRPPQPPPQPSAKVPLVASSAQAQSFLQAVNIQKAVGERALAERAAKIAAEAATLAGMSPHKKEGSPVHSENASETSSGGITQTIAKAQDAAL